MALQTGGVAQSGRQVGFAQADGAQEDDVAVVFQGGQTEEVLHLGAVGFFGPGPVELFESSQGGEAISERTQKSAARAQYFGPIMTDQDSLDIRLMTPRSSSRENGFEIQ